METDNSTIKVSQRRKCHYRTNTRPRKNKSTQKSRTLRVAVGDLSKKVNRLSKVVSDRKTILELTKSIISASTS